MLGWYLLFVAPSLAADSRIPLTLPLLQERLNTPVLSEGVATINLRNLAIDLTGDNAEFREQFYQQLQTQINRSKQPIGLDFSESLIQGDFLINRLGLLTPLSQASIPQVLTSIEQEQLKRDDRFLLNLGEQISSVIVFRGPLILNHAVFTEKVNFTKAIFLQRLEAIETIFSQAANWEETRFARTADFTKTIFYQNVSFNDSAFSGQAKFQQAKFLGIANFIKTHFQAEAIFKGTEFIRLANFTQVQAIKDVDFSQVNWRDRVLFSKGHFYQNLLFINATFEKSVAFRTTRFGYIINIQDVKLLGQADFSNALFFPKASLNVAGLAFDSEQAKILGDTGIIGRVISLPKLEGNETVFRNLIRNFRNLEQIPDANQIEYKTQILKLQQLNENLFKVSLEEVLQFDWLLNLGQWLFLSFLLLLSDYGTNFNLVFGVGIIAIAYFGFLFWFIDRWRKKVPTPILPNRYDTICMLTTSILLIATGLTNIFEYSGQPWITLIYLGLILLPLPLGLTIYLYKLGRYHDLMDSSYLVQDTSMRQLRLLIVRLPVIPEFPFFRDRYTPIPWERRWNWLNYYDFSLNNFIKLGFNDLRLRDRDLPGTISTLVWYQWSLGIAYIALLLWTVSRTIPGLNLLIYLK